MATKMQTKSYLPGYCSTQDVEDTSSWFGCYQDKKPSAHPCSNDVQSLVNRCSENDKEMLKHTMLEHEMIFHNQVYELHRLYKTQKDLMTEFQTRGLYGSSIVAEASHSNSFTSPMQSECLEKRSQTSHHVGNNSYGKAVLACNDKFHFSFTREDSVQSHPNPLLNGDSEKDSKELGRKKRKKFDLHLPAHVYIDIEDTDESDKKIFSELPYTPSIPKNATYSVSNENDTKLTIGSIHKEDQCVSNSLTQINISTCSMIDLNKPAKGVNSEGPSNSLSLHLLGLKTHSESNQMHHSSVRSSTSISDRHRVQQTTSDFLYTDVLPKREWPLSRLECGKSSSSVDFLAQTSANSNTPAVMHGNLQLKLNTNTHRNNQTFPFAHCQEKWSGQKLSARVTHFNSSVPASFTTPHAGLISPALTFVSSWAKPSTSTNDKPAVVQALPSFGPSSNPSNESLSITNQFPITCEKSGSSRNSITGLEHGIWDSRTNFFCHGTHHCSDATHLKHNYVKQVQNDHHNQTLHSNLPKDDQNGYLRRDLETSMNTDLNRAYQDVTEDKHSVRVDTCDHLAENKYGKLSLPSWFNSRTYLGESNDLKQLSAKVDYSFLNRHVQLSPRTHAVTPEVEREEERLISPGKEEHLNNITKILKNNDNMILTELGFDAKVIKSEKKTHISDLYSAICDGKNRERVRSRINLNVEFPCVDHPMASEELHDCEIVASSHSSPSLSTKTYVINLEAPISQSEMGSLHQHNHIPLRKTDASEELVHSGNTLRLAAQNLIDLSMDCHNCLDRIIPNMLVKPASDTLSWFAEVVVSCSAENPNLISDGVDQSSGDDGFDLFEAMTLNLQEIKMDQSQPKEINNKDEKEDMEDTGAASILFTKPQRGQARKRRQRRDFQNDILPGLASLSRHEVIEDLQNIGEMMKASGRPWQTGSTRRNKCRNGMKSQTSRQLRDLAITIGEVQVSERSMIGWGRTTSRFRRQRCPPGALPAST
ncbi:uncharacterized protein LOC141824880 [Curcuma longa]|uniref:uncharacterized protein LOC141824880 n=1 Tax=Curcuma longa TaxID=136217 RepID=UPI003D9F9E6A